MENKIEILYLNITNIIASNQNPKMASDIIMQIIPINVFLHIKAKQSLPEGYEITSEDEDEDKNLEQLIFTSTGWITIRKLFDFLMIGLLTNENPTSYDIYATKIKNNDKATD